MTLQRREKILALIVLAALVLEVGFILGPFSGPSTDELRRDYEKLSTEVSQKEKKLQAIRQKIGQRLADWNRRSLPADSKIARPQYERWLVECLGKAGLSGIRLEPGEPRTRPGIYTSISMNVRSQGDLGQLAAFLYQFYSAGYLHKIRQLSFHRLENSSQFEFIMSIEGLSLNKADSRNKLPEETVVRLPLSSAKEYQKALVRRWMESDRYVEGLGIFTPYAPPPPPPRPVVQQERKPEPPPSPPPSPQPPPFDHAKYAFLTAVTEVAGKPQIWIHARTKGETYFLHQGDSIHIGSIQGTVGPIDLDSRTVQILVNGRSYLLRHGQCLYEAVHSTTSANTVSAAGG